jgi:cysteine desulfurase / selenocysteine lyase
MEHHSNIVPWQILAEQTGAKIRVIPMNDRGELLMDEFEKMLSDRTKIVAVVHLSNSLGTVNPVKEIIDQGARSAGRWCWWTGRSGWRTAAGCAGFGRGFLRFSGHKLYGPTGIGVLYGKGEAAGIDAALSGRRGHDQLGFV